MAQLDKPHVLLTGGTGFLGKVILQELVRRRQLGDFPPHKITLLIRDSKKLDSKSRFAKLTQSRCFSKLESGWSDSIDFINGELKSKGCGLNPDVYAESCQKVTHIIHCAASVDFNLPLADAAASNIDTCLNILEFAENCPNLQKIVLVSTAYVTPHRPGKVQEQLAALPAPAEELLLAAKSDRTDEKALLKSCGHPNTYTLTKSIAEHLAARYSGNLPLTIVRPSIISAAWQYPFPGWLDSRGALGGYAALFGAGFLHVMEGSVDTTFDIVPVDIVADHVIENLCLVRDQKSSKAEQENVHIVHSVAGLRHGSPAKSMISVGLEYFGRNVVFQPPYWKYMGVRSPKYYWYRFTSQTFPLSLARLYYDLTRNERKQKQVRMVMQGIEKVNQCFPYFCLHTYDFATTQRIPDNFSMEAYLDVICIGVHKHLLLGNV
ncbi:hypothetical protein B0A52_07686 [Exophiala mesophila]|uniref:Fatty acyl-CoA reductase n=1 Tax=Exophiala mesophila TaxID=212818 RepID=A0A438MZS0_EXOME|nr:hypothetical protein B0A52_07686 [Exophiala mesophila]